MKYGDKFTYNGHSSTEFDLYLVSPDEDPEYDLGIDRDLSVGETTRFRESANHLGATYNDVLQIYMMVTKDPDKYSGLDRIIRRTELSSITGWLTSPELPQELYFDDASDSEEKLYYYGVFTEVKPFVVSGEIYGIELTFTCSSQYAFTQKESYTCADGSSVIINNTSDEWEKSVYPFLEITPTATGEVIISNTTIGKSLKFNGKNQNIVYIDCKNNIVYDKAGVLKYSDLGWGVDTIGSFWWPELVHGNNTISVSGANLKLTCQYPRKVGEF